MDAPLEAAVQTVRSSGGIPGLQVAVEFPDGTIWITQAGYGVLANGQKVGPNTLFNVGSISKTFTGAMALRLMERGVIGLDDPVSTYLPSYPNGSKITIRMLLNHTSGIRDIFEPAIYKNFEDNKDARWTVAQAISLVGRPYFAPGTNYHYSSTNFMVLGEVIEKVTGKKLATLVHEELLTPLGMTHTYLQWEEKPKGVLAHGYQAPLSNLKDVSDGQSLIPFVSVVTGVGPAGGMASTASDIVRWVTALYDGSLFDTSSMVSMTDVTLTKPFKPHLLYGLAFEQLPIAGHIAWGHRGHMDGFWSTMAYFPDSGISIAILTNSDWINPLLSIQAIYRAIPGT
jgi:D-alanyl-D-alanine carboxypeptidase